MTNLPDEYLKALGPDLGEISQRLCDDVSWLHLKWKQYRTLFVESQERIDLLNRVGGTFFFIIQEVLHDDVLMHIARLVDRKKHKDKENLSLLQLASTVQAKAPKISGEIYHLVGEARKKGQFVDDWRNRRLAHTSLDVALGRKAKELPGIELKQIEGFLRALRDALNKIPNHFWQNGGNSFQNIYAERDAEDVVSWLKRAVDAKKRDFNL
jgi:AbiU2